MNNVVLVGRIATEITVKTTAGNDVKYCRFRIAVPRKYTNTNGERKTDFIPIIAWRNAAAFLEKYFEKGRWVGIQGELNSIEYQAEDGSNRTMYEVTAEDVYFIGNKPKGAAEEGGELTADIENEEDLSF